jgi:uncharacterized membrane protein YhhN
MTTMPRTAQQALTTAAAAGLFGVYLICSLLNLTAELNGWDAISRFTLVWAMPLLIGFLVTSTGRPNRMVSLMLFGLFFSWLGDIFHEPQQLKIGLFMVAQLAYVAAFLPRWKRSLVRRPAAIVGYGLLGATVVALLIGRSGNLAVLVVLYGFTIVAMAILATGIDKRAAVGGLFFLVSDSMLGIKWFYQPAADDLMDFLIMVGYLVAQAAIILGVVRLHRTTRVIG